MIVMLVLMLIFLSFSIDTTSTDIIDTYQVKRHLNYREVANDMRKRGIQHVFRAREKDLKKEFKIKVLNDHQLNLIADKNCDPVEKNKILTGVHEKFRILKDYLFRVVSIVFLTYF